MLGGASVSRMTLGAARPGASFFAAEKIIKMLALAGTK
jgi:hypothetical protein